MEVGKPLNILFAEDDPVSSKILGKTLQALGYRHHGVSNGKEALEWFAANQPPIIISDWMMPQMDGLTFCQRVRDLGLAQYTYFIMLTANTGQAHHRKAMDSGVDDFLSKPIRRDDLFIRLRVAERIIRQRWESEAKISKLARFPSDNPNPVLETDRDGRIVYANGASKPLLEEWGCAIGDALPMALQNLARTPPQDGKAHETELMCAKKIYSFAVTSVNQDGDAYIYGHDITARKKAETELIAMRNQAVSQSLQDALTGIGNRVLFQQRFPELIERTKQNGRKMALVLVDIDNFKDINDGYGHKVGDQVIVHVGHTLRDRLKWKDSVCRWGGDELVLLISDLPDRVQMGPICERLMDAVKQGAVESDLPANITLSMGFSVYPDDADCMEGLLQRADHALYQAKADGRNCWREYKGDTGIISGAQNLFQRLVQTLSAHEIQTHFQPVWDVRNQTVAGVEALARWKDPQLGFISPDQFIPLAEAKGLIVELSRQVLKQSLQMMHQWMQAGHDLTLSVNLSKRQLVERGFLDELVAQVDALSLPHQRIIFEVTERQSILGHAVGRSRLQEMSQMGFRLSLDDFGSGYSSFDLVGELPFDELKIYSGLIKKMTTNRGSGIVQAVVDMGHTLGLTVVAEGVEKPEQVEALSKMGIHKIQGYYYSKPLCPPDLLDYLTKHPKQPTATDRPRSGSEKPSNISF